jgi:GT2 family glycosyltransferase
MEFPKVLVASPTYEGMKYCHEKFFKRIKSLDYPKYDILIVDNSESEEYFNQLMKEGVLLIRDNTKEKDKMIRLINSRNKIIDFAVNNNYDYILMLDSDVMPPKNIIQELLNCKKDIVSGIYYNYFIVSGKTQWLPVAWKEITEKEFEVMTKQVNFPSFIKSHLDIKRHLTEEEVNTNNLLEVLVPSAGCMLISKKVFSKIKYGLIDTKNLGLKTTDDIFFILEARKKGFASYCCTKIKCEHIVLDKFKVEEGFYKHPIYDD